MAFINLINTQKGFALPLVLGVSAMILVMIMAISDTVSRKIGLVTELDRHCRAELIAYSGFNETLFILLVSNFTPTGLHILTPPEETVHDLWPTDMTDSRTTDSTAFWNLYGEPIELSNGAQAVLRDTGGMVSPVFPSPLLNALLSRIAPGRENAALDGLADWQDKDDFRRISGAEYWDYRTAGFPYAPRNSFIQCISEWRLIMGMDNDLFDQIKDELTYWPSFSTNYLTMSPKLLRAVLNENEGEGERVNHLLALRRDGHLTSAVFSAITGIMEDEYDIFFPSGLVQITITAEVETARSRIKAVVSKRPAPNQPYTILEWQR